jgi:MoxR-like ATPase
MQIEAAESPGLEDRDRKRIEDFAVSIENLRVQLGRRIVGQNEVIVQVLAAILAEGHCLIVGLPGLAKTLLVSSLSELLSLNFKRIQVTPDMMPSDITGASIISDDGSGHRDFRFLKGPIFANVILADEINRTPPKTQAALIEAMEERQVSGPRLRLPLERPFFVLATQNPIELQGTYPLPVTQLDRFLFSITIDYPSDEEEFRMLVLTTSTYTSDLKPLLTHEEVVDALALVRKVTVEPAMLDYVSRLVRSTRPSSPMAPKLSRDFVAWGAGPRATQALLASSKAMALMAGRPHVTADDVHAVAVSTLRHRIILKYQAEAEGIQTEDIVLRTLLHMPDGLYTPPAPTESKPERRKATGFLGKWLRRG